MRRPTWSAPPPVDTPIRSALPPSVSITNGFRFGTPNFLNRAALPDERRWQVADTVNWLHGSHNFKFGGDYIHTNDRVNNLFSGFGVYSYSTLASLLHGLLPLAESCDGIARRRTAAAYTQGFGIPGVEFTTGDFGFFAEDNWKLTRRLTAHHRPAYEYEKLPSPFSNLIIPALPQTGFMPSQQDQLRSACRICL